MYVSYLKNEKRLLETRGNMPFNLQKTADQKTLNLKREIEILLLVNEGKLLLHKKKNQTTNHMTFSIHFDLSWTTKQKMLIHGIIEDRRQVAKTLVM